MTLRKMELGKPPCNLESAFTESLCCFDVNNFFTGYTSGAGEDLF